MHNPHEIVLPPWRLKGEGIILMCSFKRAFETLNFFTDDRLTDHFIGGIGYVMVVNYHESPVGPYKELLIIPGKFRTSNGKRQNISKIYVDSEKSLINGRKNWGIPKELADISWLEKNGHVAVSASIAGQDFFQMDLKKRPIKFPLTTSILPIRLHQHLDEKTFNVNPTGRGIAQLASVDIGPIDSAFFPDIRNLRSLAFYVSPFQMKFP